MKPERAQELYSDYAEGTLTPALQQALEQHFAADPAARTDYDQFSLVYSLLEQPLGQELEVPLGFRAKVLERAALTQAQRETTLGSRAAGFLGSFFGGSTPSPQRRATGGILAALAVVAGLGIIFVHPPTSGPNTGNLIPTIPAITPAETALIQKVDMQAAADKSYHLFHLHLPSDVTAATVNAYVVTATEQITDPARLAGATPALTGQHLTNHQGVQIPIAPVQMPPPGSTLNLLAQWTADSPTEKSGAEVAFTPFGAPDPATPAPANAAFLEAMQAVAAHYGATVIVDVTAIPTVPVSAEFSGTDPLAALDVLTKQAGYTVRKSPDGASVYYVSPAP